MKWFIDRILARAVCFKGGGGGAQRIITEDQVAAAEVAAKQWNDYQTRYVPFEKKFIEQQGQPVEGKQATGRGMVNADLQQNIAKVPPINPNLGMAYTGSVPITSAKARAGGMADVSQGAVDGQTQGLSTVVALGRGQQVEALQGISEQAATSGQIANAKMLNDVESGINERGRIMGNVGSAVGMAAGAAKAGMASSGVSRSDVTSGSSSGPSGYNIKGNDIYWNSGERAGSVSDFT